MLRDLTAAWEASRDYHEAARRSTGAGPRWRDYKPANLGRCALWRGNDTPDRVWHFLRDELGAALSPFRPEVLGPGFDDPGAGSGGERTLYSVCCAELLNHIGEQAHYLSCENERCGRRFARKQGGTRHGGHHTRGVRYCSTSCQTSAKSRRARHRRQASPGVPRARVVA